jgi:hypothetical protein
MPLNSPPEHIPGYECRATLGLRLLLQDLDEDVFSFSDLDVQRLVFFSQLRVHQKSRGLLRSVSQK